MADRAIPLLAPLKKDLIHMNATIKVQHVTDAMRAQTRTRFVYTLVSAAILIMFLVAGFNFASNQSLGGFDRVFYYTWPHELEFYAKDEDGSISAQEPLDITEILQKPVTNKFGEDVPFVDVFSGKDDYPERLRNLVADETGLGGANIVLVRDWGAFYNPLNYLWYAGNISNQLFAFITRTVQSAVKRPGRIFFFPPLSGWRCQCRCHNL